MFFNYFSPTLNENQSDDVLFSIIAEMELGNRFDSVISELAQTDYAKNKKIHYILKEIEDLLENTDSSIEEILTKYGVIYKDESVLIKHSKNLLFAFTKIAENRTEGKVFLKWVMSFALPPLGIVFIGLLIQIPLSEYFMGIFYSEILPEAERTKDYILDPNFPFYLKNLIWPKVFLLVYVSVIVLAVVMYRTIYKTNVSLIYKYNKVKFYDDFFYFFKIMDSMKKAESFLTTDQIFRHFSKNFDKSSLRTFFYEMGENASEFYKYFEKIQAPETVTLKIKKSEMYNTTWNNMNYEINGARRGFVWFLKRKRDAKIKMWDTWFRKILNMSAYTIVLIYIASTVGAFIIAIMGVL